MSNNYSTTSGMPTPVSPGPTYGQASSHIVGARSPDPYSAAPASGNSHYYVTEPTSPHWVSPMPSLGNPFSFDSSYCASPVSPNTGTRERYDVADEHVRECQSNVYSKREHDASDRALMLLQETVGVDVTSTAAPAGLEEKKYDECDYDVMSDPGHYQKSTTTVKKNDSIPLSKDDSNDVTCMKNGFDVVRERGANLKALALLEQTVGHDISDVAKATSVYLYQPTLAPAEDSALLRRQLIQKYKAKKEAEKRAEGQKMLQADAEFESNHSVSNGPAALSEEERSSKYIRAKMIAEYKAKKKLHKIVGSQVSAQEALAQSTRVPTKRDGDHEVETFGELKCEADVERENNAMKRALRLLDERPGLMA